MAKRDAFYQATNPGQIEEVNYTSAPLMPTDNPELTPEAEAAVGVLQRQWGSDYASKVQSLEIGRQHYLAGHEEDIKSLEKDYPGIGNDPRLINGIVRLVEAGRLKKD
jgi:hypothetical protein